MRVFPRAPVACVHLCVPENDGQREGEKDDGEGVGEYKEKPTPESGGSLHSRLCRAPGAALFIKAANLHYVCVRVQGHKSMFSCQLFVCVCAHFQHFPQSVSAQTHVCSLKLIKPAQLKASCYLAVRPEEVILWYTDNFGQNTGL